MEDWSWQSMAPPCAQDLEQDLIVNQEPQQYNQHLVDHIHLDSDLIDRLVEVWMLQA